MNLRPARGTPWWIALLWVPAVLVRARIVRLVLTTGAAAATSFFRDPDRTPEGPGLVAAADGKIREVTLRDDGRWFVSTYLALYNVHVSRMPCDGTVLKQEHFDRDHRLAFSHTAHTNEQRKWHIDTEHGELEMTQFSGAAARRIVPYVGPGATLRRGDRIGLIRFGSRVDLLLPHGLVPTVREGERVRGSEDVVAVREVPT